MCFRPIGCWPTASRFPRCAPSSAASPICERLVGRALVFGTIAIIAAAIWIDHPLTWLAAFVLMGPQFARFASLAHEAAHRLLFSNKRLNDFVGRWLLGYPAFVSTDLYRRGHMAHHKDEFGPNEPDMNLYNGYPITAASMSAQATPRPVRQQRLEELEELVPRASLRRHPRARAPDPRLPGRVVRRVPARRLAAAVRPAVVPSVDDRVARHQPASCHRRARRHAAIGRPPAHHPFRPPVVARPVLHGAVQHRLPPRAPRRHGCAVAEPAQLHAELVESGWITPGLEYPTYRALWRKLSSRPA